MNSKIKVSKTQLAELEKITVAYMLAVDNEVGLSKDDVKKAVLLLDPKWDSMFTVSEGEAEATMQQQVSDLERKVAWLEKFTCKTCGGVGSVGSPPDDYYDCPECVDRSNKHDAEVVMRFANMVKGAYLDNFVDGALTVYDVYQSARNHVKDNYRVDTEVWQGKGAERAKLSHLGPYQLVFTQLVAASESLSSSIAKNSYDNEASQPTVDIADIEPQCQMIDQLLATIRNSERPMMLDKDGNQELIANLKGRVNLQNIEIEKLVERLQHSEDLNTKQQSHIDTLVKSALYVHENKPEFHSEGMGCGLEDRNIHCRYEAMEYGWEKAIETMYADVIAPIDEALAATNQDKE